MKQKWYKTKRFYASLSMVLLASIILAIAAWPKAAFTEHNERRDQVLQKYFTPESIAKLSTVPLRVGESGAQAYGGLSVGNDIGSRIAAFWWCYPWERQVLVTHPQPVDRVIFHEYVHQADYFGLIPREAFVAALARLKEDPAYGEQVRARERNIVQAYSANIYGKLALWYDDGLTREMVAHLSTDWAFRDADWPPYFLKVYDQALKITEKPPTAGQARKNAEEK